MKILTIVGARPQFVKAAALSREIAKYPEITEILLHTGQHYDSNMSDIFFTELEIPKPDYNLAVANLNHGAMTGRMLEGIEQVIIKEKPDVVLVYGDTNSTLAGALAAKKLHVQLAHVEAGLRSYDMYMPEEINRILTDRISDILFCPTAQAVKNLKAEGFDNFKCQIHQTGDIMYDAALFYAQKAEKMLEIMQQIPKEKYILCTIHRAENTDNPDRLKSIFQALCKINKEIKVILPLHPRTRSIIEREKIIPGVSIIDPVGYLTMIQLTKNCEMVITDSGGLQKESYFFQKKCIIIRDTTEWIELVENGWAVLSESECGEILNVYSKLLNKREINFTCNLYGKGNTAYKIMQIFSKSTHD
jgi:UDP-GlcNAc3NAcA epimerase